MVLSFFRRGGDALDHIEHEITSMLGDCRHRFDLAMGALITDADIGPIGDEVRATDRRINGTEEAVGASWSSTRRCTVAPTWPWC